MWTNDLLTSDTYGTLEVKKILHDKSTWNLHLNQRLKDSQIVSNIRHLILNLLRYDPSERMSVAAFLEEYI